MKNHEQEEHLIITDNPFQSEEEIRLGEQLEQWRIPYPSEEEMERTINVIHRHMRHQQHVRKQSSNVKVGQLLRLAVIGTSAIRPSFWMISLLMYVLGFLYSAMNTYISPYLVMVLLSPVPIVIGAWEIFRSRQEGMMELEMSCPWQASHLILAKLTIVAAFNIVLNAVCSVLFASVVDEIVLVSMMKLWLLPFLVMTALQLLLSVYFRLVPAITAMGVIYLVATMIYIRYEQELEHYMNHAWYTVGIVGSVVIIMYMLYRLSQRHTYREMRDMV